MPKFNGKDAEGWIFLWIASDFLTTWPEFVKAMLHKFVKATFAIPGGKLGKLMQTTTVANYIDKFEELSTRVTGLPNWFLLESFITELREDI